MMESLNQKNEKLEKESKMNLKGEKDPKLLRENLENTLQLSQQIKKETEEMKVEVSNTMKEMKEKMEMLKKMIETLNKKN